MKDLQPRNSVPPAGQPCLALRSWTLRGLVCHFGESLEIPFPDLAPPLPSGKEGETGIAWLQVRLIS